MFKAHTAHLEQIFLRQFERDGDRFVYRKYGRGAPIPVTVEEREQFRLQYRKASGRMILGAVLIVITAITLGISIAPEFIDAGPGTLLISIGAIGVIWALSIYHTTAPMRVLERRSPVGPELSKEEWQSRHFATKSWPLLTSIFLISAIVCVGLVARSKFEDPSDYLWAVGSAVLSILGARALWLKYQLGRRAD